MSENFDFEKLKSKYMSEMNNLIAEKRRKSVQNDAKAAVEMIDDDASKTKENVAVKPSKTTDNSDINNAENTKKTNRENEDIFGRISENLPDFNNSEKNDNEKTPPKEDNNYGNDGNEPNIAATAKGTLSIEVTSATRAVPIENAYVIVSENSNDGQKLLYTLQTDRNGQTRSVELATYPKELSNNPEFFGKPYKTYNVTVRKDGFFAVEDLQVPIFAERHSIQPINMIPIPENYSGERVKITNETQSLPIVKEHSEASEPQTKE